METRNLVGVYAFFLGLLVTIAVIGSLHYIERNSVRKVYAQENRNVLAQYEESKDKQDDPTKGETAWGYQVARVMTRYFPEARAGMISAAELVSLAPNLKEGDPIPWEDIKDSEIVTVEISGADLISSLASGVKFHPRKNANFLQVYGLKVLCVKDGEITKVSRVLLGDEIVRPDKVYRVAMSRFMAEGGGPFIGLESIKIVTESASLVQALRKYLFPAGRVGKMEPTYLFAKPEKKSET